jgi:hypothetical protein
MGIWNDAKGSLRVKKVGRYCNRCVDYDRDKKKDCPDWCPLFPYRKGVAREKRSFLGTTSVDTHKEGGESD